MDSDALDGVIVHAQDVLIRACEWTSQVFLTPGNLALDWFATWAPRVAEILGVQSADEARTTVAVLSLISWFFTGVLVMAVYNVIRDTVLCVTSLYRRCVTAMTHRLRMIRRAVTEPIRKLDLKLAARKLRFLEEFEISELHLEILRAQSIRPPGHAITAIEVAEELHIRPMRAQQALSFLARLHLMEISFATSDGCPGYFLTRPGEAYLAACNAPEVATC